MRLLEVKDLNRSFGGLQAVNNVNFDLDKNQIKAIIGPNGAGKTTLFNLISGNLKPDSGKIFFNEENIYGFPPFEIAKKGVSRTFQNIKLFNNMTVLENVMIGRHIRTTAGFLTGMLNLPKAWKEEKDIAYKSMEIMNVLGIDDIADQDAADLSFGKQRIVEFARALALEPELLLLDEPAAGLNMYETEKMAHLITNISKRGITILLIEHDMSLVMDIANEIVVLSSGKKIAEGTPDDIQKNKEVIAIYLGDDNA